VSPGVINIYLSIYLSAGYYRFVKAMNYEEANPDQDSAASDFIRDERR
jgi:hypothetical protein